MNDWYMSPHGWLDWCAANGVKAEDAEYVSEELTGLEERMLECVNVSMCINFMLP